MSGNRDQGVRNGDSASVWRVPGRARRLRAAGGAERGDECSGDAPVPTATKRRKGKPGRR